jgi:hypothetical protein
VRLVRELSKWISVGKLFQEERTVVIQQYKCPEAG